MYLMEDRKLLDTQVFNGRQKLFKLSSQTFFSVDFWEFCFFSLFYTYLKLKSIRCSTSFCHKNNSLFDRKKELWGKKGNAFLFVVSLTWIIHWIKWTHSTHMEWWSRLFNKREIMGPNRLKVKLHVTMLLSSYARLRW